VSEGGAKKSACTFARAHASISVESFAVFPFLLLSAANSNLARGQRAVNKAAAAAAAAAAVKRAMERRRRGGLPPQTKRPPSPPSSPSSTSPARFSINDACILAPSFLRYYTQDGWLWLAD